MKKIICISFVLSTFLCLFSQSKVDIYENKKNSYMYFQSDINGQGVAEIMIESGVPGLLIGELQFKKYFKTEYAKSSREYTYTKGVKGKHNIIKSFRDTVIIGQYLYVGDVFVLDNYKQIELPLHLLGLPNNMDSVIINVNFDKKYFQVVDCNGINIKSKYSSKLVGYRPTPIVESIVQVEENLDKKGNIEGRFYIDFGNPMQIALFNNDTVKRFIKDNGLTLNQAVDRNTRRYAGVGLFVRKCSIDSKIFADCHIYIPNLKIKECIGCLGTNFFKGDLYIDKSSKIVYFN